MTTQHTPGPWRIAEMHGLSLYMNDVAVSVVQADEAAEEDRPIQHIAFVSCHADYKRGTGHKAQCAERDANARLIAAAPELLAAANRVRRSYPLFEPDADGECVLIRRSDLDALIATIDKAEGRA